MSDRLLLKTLLKERGKLLKLRKLRKPTRLRELMNFSGLGDPKKLQSPSQRLWRQQSGCRRKKTLVKLPTS